MKNADVVEAFLAILSVVVDATPPAKRMACRRRSSPEFPPNDADVRELLMAADGVLFNTSAKRTYHSLTDAEENMDAEEDDLEKEFGLAKKADDNDNDEREKEKEAKPRQLPTGKDVEQDELEREFGIVDASDAKDISKSQEEDGDVCKEAEDVEKGRDTQLTINDVLRDNSIVGAAEEVTAVLC